MSSQVNLTNSQTGAKSLVCEVCNKVFSKQFQLVRHLRVHTDSKPSIWDTCKREFSARTTFDVGVQTEEEYPETDVGVQTEEEYFESDVCDEESPQVEDISIPSSTNKIKSFVCKVCDEEFSAKRYLIRHHSTHNQSVWDLCKKKLSKQSHLDTEPGQDQQVSSERFDSDTKLEPITFTKEKSFKCEICYKVFRHKKFLRYHLLAHIGKKLYACEICDKRFTNQSVLTVHLRTHSSRKAYICDICNKGFCGMRYLKMHRGIHEMIKPFYCGICDKTFSLPISFKTHLLTHENYKPFVCGVCEKAFYSDYKLKVHVRTHTGEKPYVCVTCDKRFAGKSNLQAHNRTHTGEKPYKCPYCNKGYSYNRGLQSHLNSHTAETATICYAAPMQPEVIEVLDPNNQTLFYY